MADQVPQGPPIQIGRALLDLMDLNQIVGQRAGARQILALQPARPGNPRKVPLILPALLELRQHEKLARVFDRMDTAAHGEGADVQRPDVAGQAIVRRIVPQYGVRPVGHVLVAVRARAHRLQHHAPGAASDTRLDDDRRPVSESLQYAAGLHMPKRPEGTNRRIRPPPLPEILFQCLLGDLHPARP